MVLKRINNNYHLFGDGKIERGDFFYCYIDDSVNKSSMNSLGEGWAKTSVRLIASSVEKEGLPKIDVVDLENKIKSIRKNIDSFSKDELIELEYSCVYDILQKSKWSHLSYNVKRPYPKFFWEEVDSMINSIITKDNTSDLERDEFDAEIETIDVNEVNNAFSYSEKRLVKPKLENGFVKITLIK